MSTDERHTAPTPRRRRGPGARLATPVAAGLLLAAAAPAQAQEYFFRSTTLFSTRPDDRARELDSTFPIYELLTLRASGIHTDRLDDLTVVLSTWGMLDPGRIDASRGAGYGFLGGDLALFYTEAKLAKRRLVLRAGRHFVIGGAVRPMLIDGATVTLATAVGFGVSAFGGVPVASRFSIHAGDVAYGARAFYRRSVNAEVGASFVHVLDAGHLARLDLGLDGRWVPHKAVTLSAYAVFAPTELRLAEANAAAALRPWRSVQFSFSYARTAPDLFLPRNSIFSVFAVEHRDEAGASAALSPLERLRLYTYYYFVMQEQGELGHRAGAKATLTLGRNVSPTTLGIESRALALPSNGYVEVRAFAMHRFERGLFVSADASAYLFREAINGESLSFRASGTAGWDLAFGLRVMLVAAGGVTPWFEQRYETLLNVTYGYLFRKSKAAP